jgi:uncharacterized membrane protein
VTANQVQAQETRVEACPRYGRAARRALLGTTLLALAFVAATYAGPLVGDGEGRAAEFLRRAYGSTCHQRAERSMTVGGGRQAVCARCAGLYLGGLLGLGACAAAMTRPWWPRRRWFALVVVPSAVDALAGWLGWPALDNLPRLVLAVPAGCFAGVFLAIGVADLFETGPGSSPSPASFPV